MPDVRSLGNFESSDIQLGEFSDLAWGLCKGSDSLVHNIIVVQKEYFVYSFGVVVLVVCEAFELVFKFFLFLRLRDLLRLVLENADGLREGDLEPKVIDDFEVFVDLLCFGLGLSLLLSFHPIVMLNKDSFYNFSILYC